MAREELSEEMRTKFSPELVAKAWDRIVVTSEVTLDSLKKFVASAQSVGFLRGAPDMSQVSLPAHDRQRRRTTAFATGRARGRGYRQVVSHRTARRRTRSTT